MKGNSKMKSYISGLALAASAVMVMAPSTAIASEGEMIGSWTDRKGTNFIFMSGGKGKIEQTRPINGNPGKITTEISWSLNSAGDKLTYKFIAITLSGSAGYDQTKPANGKSYTVSIVINSNKLQINGSDWYQS